MGSILIHFDTINVTCVWIEKTSLTTVLLLSGVYGAKIKTWEYKGFISSSYS